MGDKVSVVIPAHNAEKTIGFALESVLGQTYSDFEVVVADDASTDKTVDVVRSYGDERIKLLKHDRNRGEGAARDFAIANSEGDWIAVLDADDAWDPGRLSMMLALVPDGRKDCILVDDIASCFEVEGKLFSWRPMRGPRSKFLNGGDKSLCDLLEENSYLIKPLIPSAPIHSLGLLHSDLTYGADAQFFIRLLKLAQLKIRCTNECLYLYRMTPGAMSTKAGSRNVMKSMLLGLISGLDFSPRELAAIERKVKVQERHIEYEPFGQALKARNYLEALRYGLRKPRCLLLFLWRLPRAIVFWHAVSSRGGVARSLH